ncbi:MAG: hypothetical protein JW741_12775 [Sedimentisphaerales bacterium]|nr:hypothetical protein [Sedimentisphaerales bacterium]
MNYAVMKLLAAHTDRILEELPDSTITSRTSGFDNEKMRHYMRTTVLLPNGEELHCFLREEGGKVWAETPD